MFAPPLIDWGFATLMLAGEKESGDLHVVKAVNSGALVAVVDGLGHGAEAAVAARAAVKVLEQYANEPPLSLLRRCHQALVRTRGVVMSLALFDRAAGSMTWLGVGNVEGVLLYADAARRVRHDTLVTRGGIVGSDLPPVRAKVVSVAPRDTLIFATDGVRSPFTDGLPPDAPPQQLADQILAHHGKGTDDALVLVARYMGGAAVGA
ncbi:MAG TPA: SpoIIE family protein phosphatase [Gemmatimonadales bacterium]|nr:SpoIIE family protein phosphatase [Gemmatimonadales bacterium]